MFNSIRFRFTTIYFVLVFVAMIVAGIFIISSIESYNLNVVTERLDDIYAILRTEIESVENLSENGQEINDIIQSHVNIGLREEIYVIDVENQKIIATSTENHNRLASDILNYGLLLEGYTGHSSEKDISVGESISNIKTRDKVYPVYMNDQLEALVYLRYDLKDVNTNIENAKSIILNAILYSVIITIILGFIISKSITDPINEVTEKATKLAEGEYDQVVDVKSNDEIGKLSESFNFLTYQLRTSMSETSREKSKLEAIINHMEDGLIALDAGGEIIHFNPKAMDLLNVSDENKYDVVGDLISLYNTCKIDSENGIGTKVTNYSEKIVEINFAPFIDLKMDSETDGKGGVVFVIHDITESEKLEILRREFVANVSHELKTPLTSIRSYTETILDGNVDDPEVQKTFLQVVNSEAERMSRLVRDLLELSNYDSEAVKMNMKMSNVHALIEQAILKVKVTADNKNQTIDYHYDLDGDYNQSFDYDKIEQVLLNILSNAIKYTDENGHIKINLTNNKGKICVEVSDNGMGIPEEDVARIFDRFYRVDKARSRALGGSGLGLSIAKEIVEAHGGEIKISSVIENGTKVTIVI